jgi:hypothetical protein
MSIKLFGQGFGGIGKMFAQIGGAGGPFAMMGFAIKKII